MQMRTGRRQEGGREREMNLDFEQGLEVLHGFVCIEGEFHNLLIGRSHPNIQLL
jgi:hypothetical protein